VITAHQQQGAKWLATAGCQNFSEMDHVVLAAFIPNKDQFIPNKDQFIPNKDHKMYFFFFLSSALNPRV
jgi:hypothetical protein